MHIRIALIAAVALAASGAYAQQNPPQQKGAPDPNEKICEDVVQTGSRLATKRFCATRSEWEDKKRQDREAVEKAQLNPCVIQTTTTSGKPSC
jgi:hypothetical protein